jgi:hypothetical protein
VRKAETGTAFCRRHGDAIFGAMLGALRYLKSLEEIEHFCGEGEPCLMEGALRRK